MAVTRQYGVPCLLVVDLRAPTIRKITSAAIEPAPRRFGANEREKIGEKDVLAAMAEHIGRENPPLPGGTGNMQGHKFN